MQSPYLKVSVFFLLFVGFLFVGRVSYIEFLLMMAILVCFVAMSIDIVLPALKFIGPDLGIRKESLGLVIVFVFSGMAVGQFIYGALSDFYGRKTPIYIGFLIFILGTLVCYFSVNIETMLFGRLLQGFGASAPRIISMAIIRDFYSGIEMSKIMSIVTSIFIVVPIISPTVGQIILYVADWRNIFLFLFAFSVLSLLWFWLRMPESLGKGSRQKFSYNALVLNLMLCLKCRDTIIYILALGLVLGAFVGFLGSAQPLLQDSYGLGGFFTTYFAALASGIALSSYLNSKLVSSFGLNKIVFFSLILCGSSSFFISINYLIYGVNPNIYLALLYFFTVIFCGGLIFGNLKTLAMEPYISNAGTAAGIVGGFSTLIASVIGGFISTTKIGSILPISTSYMIFSIIALCLIGFFVNKD